MDVASAQRHTAPLAPAVDERRVLRQIERNLLSGVGWFKLDERGSLRRLAASTAASELSRERERRESLRRAQQDKLDQANARLLANDRAAVWWEITASLKKVPIKADVIAVEGSTVDLRIEFPGVELVPGSAPAVTASGRLSTRRYTKTERNALYIDALAAATIAVLRTSAAAAPGIDGFRVLVVRAGELGLDPVLFAKATRDDLASIEHMGASAGLGAVNEIDFSPKGRTRELTALPTSGVIEELLNDPQAPPPPFDLKAMADEQAAEAAEFDARISVLRPTADPPEPARQHPLPDSPAPAGPERAAALPAEPPSPASDSNRPEGPRSTPDRSKLTVWLSILSLALVVVVVGIVPALGALALAVQGLRGSASQQPRRRYKIAVAIATLALALWIAIVVDLSLRGPPRR
jgi:hypothetical protein